MLLNMFDMRDLRGIFLTKFTTSEMVVSSVIGWCSFYGIIKNRTGQGPEWTIRLLTAIHATVITVLSILDWCYINKWDMETFGQSNTKFQEVLLSLTLGYFIFDFLWIINYQTEGSIMYFHHLSSIICLSYILFREISASEVLVGVSGLEITNPCLQLRWFLRTYGYQGTFIHMVTEIIFMVSFLTLRIYYGSYLTYNLIFNPNCPFILKAGTVSLYCISWMFVRQMFLYALRKYVKYDKNKKDTRKD